MYDPGDIVYVQSNCLALLPSRLFFLRDGSFQKMLFSIWPRMPLYLVSPYRGMHGRTCSMIILSRG